MQEHMETDRLPQPFPLLIHWGGVSQLNQELAHTGSLAG